MRSLVGSLALAPLLVGLVGCADLDGTVDPGVGAIEESHQLIESSNGLTSINGLSSNNGLASSNGLSSNNGLSTSNGLASSNGLSSTNGLMTTADGRTTVSYLVRCALPAGSTLVKQDQFGTSYTFAGQVGLAPEWRDGACDAACQEYVSACLLAHINTSGMHVPLWIVSDAPSVGWGLSPSYPNQEGAFFGNIMVTGAHGVPSNQVAAHYCIGTTGGTLLPAPGRIGSDQGNAPYTNPFPLGGLCALNCATAPLPYTANGFKSCGGWTHVLTVWRHL